MIISSLFIPDTDVTASEQENHTTIFLNSIRYNTDEHDKSVGQKFFDPYRMNWNSVKICHFRDARIYDPQIREPGWQVQYWYAKKKYLEWLGSIRKIHGWEGFRRAPIEVTQEITNNDGNTYVLKSLVPYNISKKTKRNTPKYLPAISKVKGVNYDDDSFRPKMFTRRMGIEISKRRNKLGLTQVDLAQRMNVSVNLIRQIEMGGLVGFNPDSILVKSLAKVLNIPSIKYIE
jgi:ribosome-binding protein aMBF1 (putative translation factor)